MVIVEAATPSAAIGEVPEIELLTATGAAPMKMAFPPATETGERSWSALISALRDFREQMETPAGFDVEQLPYTLLPPVSVAEKVGV